MQASKILIFLAVFLAVFLVASGAALGASNQLFWLRGFFRRYASPITLCVYVLLIIGAALMSLGL